MNDAEKTKHLNKHKNKQSPIVKYESEQFPWGMGGKNKKKSLNKKSLKSLQKMARNKKIKITKKLDGKVKYIKKSSLIRKLCK